LHRVAGKPMVEHVLDTAAEVATTTPVVVYGHGGERLREGLAHRTVVWVEQAEQLGTGHAVAQTLTSLPDRGLAMILYGDVPLLRPSSLANLLAAAQDTGFAVLTVTMGDPSGYGRIVRDPPAMSRALSNTRTRRLLSSSFARSTRASWPSTSSA
jgi:bifunctional UDP-N-acetylglucosamine pyrophosphorylase / glucosamine-1-phosphate N-acetyltransferase